MKKQEGNQPRPVFIQTGQWKRVLKSEGEPVLSLDMQWPKLPEDTAGLRRVNRYYQCVSEQWKTRWEGAYYQDACMAAAEARAAGQPVRPWEAVLRYTVTRNGDGLLSLYLDAYEYTGGAHGIIMRRGDTWEPYSGTPRTLRSFYPPKSRWRRMVLDEIQAQAAARVSSGETLYFDDWPTLIEQSFHPDHFYLTEDAVAVYYPLYTIAPYAEGIPVFFLPYPNSEATSTKKDQKNPEKV